LSTIDHFGSLRCGGLDRGSLSGIPDGEHTAGRRVARRLDSISRSSNRSSDPFDFAVAAAVADAGEMTQTPPARPLMLQTHPTVGSGSVDHDGSIAGHFCYRTGWRIRVGAGFVMYMSRNVEPIGDRM